MSDIIQPILVMDTSWGAITFPLEEVEVTGGVAIARIAAETEAAHYLIAAPEDVLIFSATVLMLAADMAEAGVQAWLAGLPVHSVDCDCETEEPAAVVWLGTGMQCHAWHSEDCGV